MGTESVNSQSSGDHGDHVDNVYWRKLHIMCTSDWRAPSLAHKWVTYHNEVACICYLEVSGSVLLSNYLQVYSKKVSCLKDFTYLTQRSFSSQSSGFLLHYHISHYLLLLEASSGNSVMNRCRASIFTLASSIAWFFLSWWLLVHWCILFFGWSS